MKKTYILIFFTVIFIQCRKHFDPQEILHEIEYQFVPDSRMGVFSIKAEVKASKIFLTGETDNKEAHLALISKLKTAGYNINDSIILLPDKITQPWALVSLSVANMRINPSHDAELVTQALMGTPIKILKEDDDWVLVQTPDKYLSWCEKDAIKYFDEETFLRWQKSKRAIVTDWSGFLRDSTTNEIISDIVAGCILEHSSESKDDIILITPDGRKGKMLKKNTAEFNNWCNHIPSKDKLLETAKVFMGTPYLWGGASVKAADCSGFVKTVYFLNGYIISRDASQQALYGTEIPITQNYDFMPGDLLFFGPHARNDKPERVTHVGMYLGDSEFIHSAGRVKINSFDSTRVNYSRYRTIGLLKVRRIFASLDNNGITSIKNHPWY